MVSLLLFLVLLFVVILIVWAINEASKRRSTTSKGGQWVEVPFEIVEGAPDSGDFEHETLLDKDGYLYHVERGSQRTYVQQTRPGKWRSIAEEINVMGCHFREAAAGRFLRERAPWLELERDPTNKYDKNAIKVLATWTKPNGKPHREHIGFVPKEEAAAIAAEVDPKMPMMATIDSFAPSDKYVASIYFTIHVAAQWCPHCHGDLGKMPAKGGECPLCGDKYELSPSLWVPIRA